MKYIKLITLLLLQSWYAQAKTPVDSANISVYPNPSNGKFKVAIQSPVAQKAGISIVNMMGQLIRSDSQQLAKGDNVFAYDLSLQNSGMYIVIVGGKNGRVNQKIVLQTNPTPTRSDSIDMVHYDLSLTIRNLVSKTISGTAQLTIHQNVDSLTTIKLDLLKLAVTDVKVNNQTAAFSQNDSELYVVINRKKASPQDSLVDVAITYNGQPVSDASWGGFYFSGDYAYNMGVAFTSIPHNFGRCWFPCIDNFTDRATYSFHVTTDTLFKAVCNGLMLPETPNPDGSTTWNWELNQPIPTYLASVAVSKYEWIKYSFQGINRSYPVWIAVAPADTAVARLAFLNLNKAIQCFETNYGPYPFDRVGYVGVPFNSGAMEHAANIAYPIYAIKQFNDYETLFAHELSHMWWGDLATCRTAEDMWLNEGWASFNEALFLECVYGKETYRANIKSKSQNVLFNAPTDDGGWYPVSGIPQNITYGTHVYKKGALMVHTLRTLMGDSAFFAACKSYLNRYHFADVSSEDLKNEFQQFTPVNLSNFFEKWIYSAGHSDIVVSKQTLTGNKLHIEFAELNRKNELYTTALPFEWTAAFSNQTFAERVFTLQNGSCVFDTTLPAGVTMIYFDINESYSIQLAHSTQSQIVTDMGPVAFGDALFSINVQSMGNATSETIKVTHHWVGALNNNSRLQGIQPSVERYWSIYGGTTQGFKAWGFFNYNGTASAYLDNELGIQNEDSLVLLYRSHVNEPWVVHTDNTFQPGGSKADKLGRFWVNDLKPGDYSFGIRKTTVTGMKEEKPSPKSTFRIFPNPADSENQVSILWPEALFVKELIVTNLQGQTIKQIHIGKKTEHYQLDISGIPQGEYIITARLERGIVSQKFIKNTH